jgi:hypothetical protein
MPSRSVGSPSKFHGFNIHPGCWAIGAYDKLGIEVLYPMCAPLERACENGCFQLAEGYLARSDATIVAEWTSRGAYTWWKDATFNWKMGSTSISNEAELSGSSVGAGGSITFRAVG